MTRRDLPPLERWADVARRTFWTSWGFLVWFNLFESFDAGPRFGSFWWWIWGLLTIAWTVAGGTWAVGAWRRRRRSAPHEHEKSEGL